MVLPPEELGRFSRRGIGFPLWVWCREDTYRGGKRWREFLGYLWGCIPLLSLMGFLEEFYVQGDTYRGGEFLVLGVLVAVDTGGRGR